MARQAPITCTDTFRFTKLHSPGHLRISDEPSQKYDTRRMISRGETIDYIQVYLLIIYMIHSPILDSSTRSINTTVGPSESIRLHNARHRQPASQPASSQPAASQRHASSISISRILGEDVMIRIRSFDVVALVMCDLYRRQSLFNGRTNIFARACQSSRSVPVPSKLSSRPVVCHSFHL